MSETKPSDETRLAIWVGIIAFIVVILGAALIRFLINNPLLLGTIVIALIVILYLVREK